MNASLFTSKSGSWCTPEWLCNVVKTFYGEEPYLDPCADSSWPQRAGNTHWYTKEDNGLAQLWHGSIYMNPPYGREIVFWVDKFTNEYVVGRTREAILLLPARTDTRWWVSLMMWQPTIYFVCGRLRFVGAPSSAPFPSAVLYFGSYSQTLTHLLKEKTWIAKVKGI